MMSNKRILILFGYDYVKALDNIVYDNNIFCFLPEQNIKYIAPEHFIILKNKMGDRLITTKKIKAPLLDIIRSKDIDCVLTLGWRKLLALEDFNNIELLVNLHPALLPEYKGYHPVPFVILNGEKSHGITAHLITQEMDAGDIILRKEFEINEFSTLMSLQNEVNSLMPSFLEELFNIISAGKLNLKENRDEDTIIKAPKRTTADSEVNLDETLDAVFKKVKASDQERFPAYFIYNNEKVFIKMFRDQSANRSNEYDI